MVIELREWSHWEEFQPSVLLLRVGTGAEVIVFKYEVTIVVYAGVSIRVWVLVVNFPFLF